MRDPVPFSQAFRAYGMVRLAEDKSAPDIDVLRYISRQNEVTWDHVQSKWPDAQPTERLLALLGPLPASD
jgi:hypothetical protein